MRISKKKNNLSFYLYNALSRYTKQNRPKIKKTKDIEKRQLLTPYRASIPDLSIDLQSLKRL